MNTKLEQYKALSQPIVWGAVENCFTLEAQVDESFVSNISIIPTVGDRYAVIQLEDGRWELAGGTLEPGEHHMDALVREVKEELGAELKSYTRIGCFKCRSSAPEPYRPHIPHPSFIRLVGYGEIEIVGKPLNPPDGEQIAAVDVVDINEAVRRFEAIGRHDIAELYLLAHRLRQAEGRI
ncbi:NUDIX domain-containing protein [Paenibacillus harenae]|uniref:NUDIX domain-containing protein n=1 Tax=Paenibacillus harenae TaxID=306543 RepID=UPI0027931077|nr:NUDIX domain-containing protein [Paenibacillus harenae]MDQ0059572.1 8-oxo-dGTP pyrophosphatase MutT (NUDIX family) [Paenibacillus harenae]